MGAPHRGLFVGLLALMLMHGVAVAQESGPRLRSGFAPVAAAEQARAMHRGVNVLGFDPLWKDFSKRQFDERHFRKIRQAGFKTVRVVLFAFRHMDAQDRLDPEYLRSLDWVVEQALANDLIVILENQDMAWCGQHAEACRPRLVAFWEQVAERYRDAPAEVVFELLNEPNGQLDAVWNDRAAELLSVIRRTNPMRNVVVDAVGWAHVTQLPKLKLPADDAHLIASFHYYEPRPFTHQGAAFAEPPMPSLSNIPWGSPADRQRLRDDFQAAADWSKASGRPILLGEFGAYEKAPLDSRVRYLDAVAREAERHGWPWLLWQFDHDFTVYDMKKDDWVEPILKALIPDQ